MNWTTLLVIHLIGIVGYSLLLRKQAVTAKLHPWVLTTLLQTGIMIPMVLAIPFLNIELHRFTTQSILLSILVVCLSMLLLISITKSLQYLEVSVFAVVYNMRIVISTLLAAILLGEFPSLNQVLGGLLILIAIIIIRQKGNKDITKSGLLWGVAAAITISLLNTAEKQLIQDVGVFTGAPMITTAVGVIMWLVVYIKGYEVPKNFIFTKPVLSLMFLRAVSAWGFIFSLAAGALVSVANFVSSSSVIFIMLFGVILLKERDFLIRKVLASTLAIIGIVLIMFVAF